MPSSFFSKDEACRIVFLIVILLGLGSVSAATINDVMPHNFPALIEISFIADLNPGFDNLTYSWDFGDGSTAVTNINIAKHTYQNIGSYSLKLRISKANFSENKTISVYAESPAGYINSTAENYKTDMNNFNNELNNAPAIVKNLIQKDLDLNNLNSSIKKQIEDYNKASSDSQYFQIMKNLASLKVPYQVNISATIEPINFLLSQDQIDNEVLSRAGAGNSSSDNYYGVMNKWILDNLDVKVEAKTYSVLIRNSENKEYTDIKANIKPKQTLDKVYFIINGDPDKIIINGNLTNQEINGKAVALVFSLIDTEKIIEFSYADKIKPLDFPIVISPSLEELGFNVGEIVCNNNGECESGESYKNCAEDCSKPWTPTLLSLVILFVIALIVYIILQEWYKRHYESNLFKNKNELFNLVNFMNNSQNQGLKKSEIIEKLDDLGWNGEQLTYAWNKLQGYRTGMWEIPIFKWVENKQVQTELEKRKKTNNY